MVLFLTGYLHKWSKMFFDDSAARKSAVDEALGGESGSGSGSGSEYLDVSYINRIHAERDIREAWLNQANGGEDLGT